MKKAITMILVVVLMTALLCACGKETYECGLCGQNVKQKPVTVTMFAREYWICDDCADGLEELGIQVRE